VVGIQPQDLSANPILGSFFSRSPAAKRKAESASKHNTELRKQRIENAPTIFQILDSTLQRVVNLNKPPRKRSNPKS